MPKSRRLARDSRTDCVRSRECAFGNFIADAVHKAAAAEIAIINGGGIRGNRLYAAGTKLTKRDVLDELPFGNKTVLTIVAGSAILSALENGLSRIGTASGRFPQISGLAVVVDPAAAPGARVKMATVSGEMLDASREMLAGKSQVTKDSGTRLVALNVISYVETLKFVNAKVEDRIVIR